jgi:hypothetical protein
MDQMTPDEGGGWQLSLQEPCDRGERKQSQEDQEVSTIASSAIKLGIEPGGPGEPAE